MGNDDLKDLWEQQKHVPDKEKLEKEMISNYLKPKVSKVGWTFSLTLVFYLTIVLVSIILLSMNLYGYRTNPVMLSVESGLLLLSLIFLGYGIFIFMKIREINNFSKDLHELLESKMKFMRFHYEIWLIITSLEVWILSFAMNTLVDNVNGFYRINRVGFFILISLIMIAFVYAIQKLSAEISFRQLKAFLSDLEANYLAQTRAIEEKRKKMRWLFVTLILIATALLVLGVLKALSLL